jgi:hypothetical protein
MAFFLLSVSEINQFLASFEQQAIVYIYNSIVKNYCEVENKQELQTPQDKYNGVNSLKKEIYSRQRLW